MLRTLINNWWLFMLRGIFSILFAAALLFFQPFLVSLLLKVVAYTAITVLFGIFALVTGIVTLAAAARGNLHRRDTLLLLADGFVLATGGLTVLLVPTLTLASVVLLIAVASLVFGTCEIAAGFHLRHHLTDEFLLITGGLASFAFGICLLLARNQAMHMVLMLVGLYAFVQGVAITGLALRLQRLRHSVHALAMRP